MVKKDRSVVARGHGRITAAGCAVKDVGAGVGFVAIAVGIGAVTNMTCVARRNRTVLTVWRQLV